MESIQNQWEKRSKKYGSRIEGVLLKSFPRPVNEYLDQWMWEQVKNSIRRPAEKLKAKKVLDLGCGYGRLSKKILEEFSEARVCGIDISKTYVEIFNKNLFPRGKAVVGNIRKLPFKSESFDLVMAATALMYLTKKGDQKKAMDEIARVLKPEGKFIIVERNPTGYKIATLGGLIEKLRGKEKKEINAVGFSKDDMKSLAGEAGLKLEDARGIPAWTLLLPLMFIFPSLVKLASATDKVFARLLTPSMYIAHSGRKK